MQFITVKEIDWLTANIYTTEEINFTETMGKITIILINALLLSVVTAFMNMKFGYQIIEGKARYFESIETDLEKNVVKIHTPAHNDVMESYQIQDFLQGQQLKCLPSINQCRLRDIDRKTAADAGQSTEAFVHSWNKGDTTITSENSAVITELYYVNFNEVLDNISLGDALKEFYQHFKYPLYKERKVPHDAEVYNMTHFTGSRVKRAFVSLSDVCNGEGMKTVYGIDSGSSCTRLKLCKRKEETLVDCGNKHITAPMIYQCLCCKWVTDINSKDCYCLKNRSN
ncbi:unnamed protein product [Mytilus coruscus]|uniref:Uncharacterized protein n=1 Tax=Mytilus coruscus TaxID=42192 RepID=A0A6J8ATH4_MYTCO|nr:unnamed protein product [Mytilus coruscus]